MTSYRRGEQIYYIADGWAADGTPQTMESPVCDTPVTVSVSGGGLSGSTDLVIQGSSTGVVPDTLIVTASPATIMPGESATISARALTEDNCDVNISALPDTTRMAVTLSTLGAGLLEYEGVRASAFGAVLYSDLRAGRIRFIADSTGETCGFVRVGVFGEGVQGAVDIEIIGSDSLRVSASAPLRTGSPLTENGVTSNDAPPMCEAVPWPPVTQRQVHEWFRDECPELNLDISSQLGQQTANNLFSDVIAQTFDAMVESQDRPGNPFDGYVVSNGYVTVVYEVKNVTAFAFRDEEKINQARQHIDRLVAHREALRRNSGGTPVTITAPTYIVVTTSPRGSLDYNDEVLQYARDRGINLYVYRLRSRYLGLDWYLEGERLHLVLGGYNDWYAGIPLGQVPDWLDWINPITGSLRELDDVDITMTCNPVVIRQGAPDPPGDP